MPMSFWVYMLTNHRNMTLLVGVAKNLSKQVAQDERAYNVNKLVYLEKTDGPIAAIDRETYINGLSRLKKELLINRQNPGWQPLTMVYPAVHAESYNGSPAHLPRHRHQ